jgi:serine phosphatase RsbU (regulator of sigma subunit)/Flp pilus assembly protein TadD
MEERHILKHIIISTLIISLTAFLFPSTACASGKTDPYLTEMKQKMKDAATDKEKIEIGMTAAVYCQGKNDPQCVDFAEAALKTAKKSKMENECASLYAILGEYYFQNKNYRKAISAFEDEYTIRKKKQQAKPRAITCYNLGTCYLENGNQRKASKYLTEAKELAAKLGNKELNDLTTKALSESSAKQKDYKTAYDYLQKYLQAENKRFNKNTKILKELKEINEQQVQKIEEQEQIIEKKDSTIQVVSTEKEELERKKKELLMENELQAERLKTQILEKENIEKENEIAKLHNNILTLIIIAIAVSIVIAAFFTVRGFRRKKKYNKILEEKNSEITKANKELSKSYEIIHHKNKDITDSLTYAGKIQKALLRDFGEYTNLVNDYFIFYAPKDIVSGDFYWAHKIEDKFVFTVGDCTGHSVPGAFMSMLGIALLNQIVVQERELQASKILEKMRILVKSYLGQTGVNEEPKDGMDMSLCVWDLKKNEGNYSGAYNPLWQIRNGEITVFNAAKCPVGVHNKEADFEDSYFKIEKSDRYYMFSDGYSDQFGAQTHEKFKIARFKKLLIDSSSLSMKEQGRHIEKTYYAWKGDFIQIDDVCVLGIEI